MERVIHAVLIDDEEQYSVALSGVAREHDIKITSFTNLQKAKEEIPEMSNVDFIILDGKCFVEEGQTAVDFDFVPEALMALTELQSKLGRYIPYCLNTGFVERLQRYKQRMPVFEKVTDQDKLFQFIRGTVEKEEDYQIHCEYSSVYEVFKLQLLPAELKGELTETFKEVKRNNPKDYKNTLRRMRPVVEAVLKQLNEIDEYLIPAGLFKKGEPNVSGIIYHLAGKPKFNKDSGELEFYAEQVLPEHIYYSVSALYDITSKVAMHAYNKEITEYLVKSCLFALLEFLIWYRGFYVQYYKR